VAERLKSIPNRLALLAQTRWEQKAHRLEAATLRLQTASPLATLNRGYALVRQEGKTVQSVEALHHEKPFTVTLRDGWIEALATRVGKEEHP
jgi:exodeoxyribonuclease VII large subunit